MTVRTETDIDETTMIVDVAETQPMAESCGER